MTVSRILLFFGVFLASLSTNAATSSVDDTLVTKNNGEFIGLHIHRAVQAPWPNFSFAGWRLLDAGVSWRSIEPVPGTFDFNRLDIWVRMAELKKTDITYVFYGPPEWASARPTEAGANGPGSAAEPADLNSWRKYVRTVASRYKGRIKYYEIWNEPNWKNFYTGSWKQLAELVKEAALIVKEVDPVAKIILPGLASEHGLTVLDQFLDTGVGSSVDIIGYHFYTGHRPPEVMVGMLAKLKASLASHGLAKKPIWNTEFGWLIQGYKRPIDASAAGFSAKDPVYSDEEAAAFVVRAFTLLTSMGVDRSYFYAWDNESMGVFDPKAKVLKPALLSAFDALGRWLKYRPVSCTVAAQMYTCDLRTPLTGEAIVWSVGAPLSGQLLAKDWASLEKMDGTKLDLRATGIGATLAQGPYLLRK